MTKTAALVLGLVMLGMSIYGVIENVDALRTGEKRVSMRGARALDLNRPRNPIAFWFYFALSIGGTALSAYFAYYFLSGRV
jgi:hypothetical protein